MSVPQTGDVIAGKYKLGKILGAGGYGIVFEGENLDLGKKVAIKLIDRNKKSSEEAIARFRREARLAGKIESPYIVQIFDVGEDASFGLFMVMELLRGEDLRRKLDRVERLPIESAVGFARQAAIGLAKAHAAGVLHRDLKPANVFLHHVEGEPGASVKIVDFGVAKLIGEPGEHDARDAQPLTNFGQTMGTPQYMAPEQVQGFPFDHRVDVWALGAVLYEMLAGKAAFKLLPTFQETAVAIVTKPPPSLLEIAPWVPKAVADVVDKALTRDVNARIKDATTFAEMLVAAYPAAFSGGHRSIPPPSEGAGDVKRKKPKLELVPIETGAHESLELTAPVSPTSTQEAQLRAPSTRRWLGVVLVVAVLVAGGVILALAAARAHDGRSRVETTPPTATKSAPTPSAMPEASTLVAPAESSVAPRIKTQPSPTPTSASESASASASVTGSSFGGTGISSEY